MGFMTSILLSDQEDNLRTKLVPEDLAVESACTLAAQVGSCGSFAVWLFKKPFSSLL